MKFSKISTFFIFFIVIGTIVIVGFLKINKIFDSKSDGMDSYDKLSEASNWETITLESEDSNANVDKGSEDLFTANIDNCIYSVKGVNYFKTFPIKNAKMNNLPKDVILNNDNTIENEYCFLAISLEIESNKIQDDTFTINNNRIIVKDENNEVAKLDPYMSDANQDLVGTTLYFHFMVKNKAKNTVTIFYILKDSYITDNTIIFQLDPLGNAGLITYGRTAEGKRVIINSSNNVVDFELNSILQN